MNCKKWPKKGMGTGTCKREWISGKGRVRGENGRGTGRERRGVKGLFELKKNRGRGRLRGGRW